MPPNGNAMPCTSCGSNNLSKFWGEIAIHFPGMKDLDKPVVWVFPELVVCLDCGIAQFAVPEVFRQGRDFLARYKNWVSKCRDAALRGMEELSFTPPPGSFYFTIPISHDEEGAAARLLEDHRILVHPGYFYDIHPDHLVMTFIDNPDSLTTHFAKIAAACV